MSSIEAFLARADELERSAAAAFDAAADAAALTDARNRFLGRTNSERAGLKDALGSLPGPDKPAAGRRYNELQQRLDALFEIAEARVAAASRTISDTLDRTMPARATWQGSVHPVIQVINEIADIFRELGFTIALGPEVEHEWYNFGALNFPADHPAMDLHDTLYVNRPGLLMRTHTSPVQMRTLQRYAPPVRVLAPGNVYRRDFFDATHAPMFTQLEGLAIDEGVSFADLKATLMHFVKRFYGPGVPVRFGPSYFPFTEPSAQMDVQVDLNDGRGKRWMEIMGCGLVHPAVLESAGVDSERYSGWAFGMGPARIAMSRHVIPDIRLFYDSDVRFLEQFR
ncbi:MAG TPA: phenylalanine--tRNA ligase subunit alpha [Gemmatimonadaceae bacterium]|nr:phenylalanine--tRNA ligase subunit alpha [Gemmatimonadaceae bacterium]